MTIHHQHCSIHDTIGGRLQRQDVPQPFLRVQAALAQVVEMQYFGGMTDGEIALALGVSDRTVRRDWEKARLLLRIALR